MTPTPTKITPALHAYQPRFAAYMASFGRDDAAFNNTMNRCGFMAWIGDCIRTAPADAVTAGSVVNHDAFTAHCWSVAQTQLLERFPA